MKTQDLIYDTIHHEAKEATKNSPNMRFGVDMSSYWHNRTEYFECLQKIGEENMHIDNINIQAKWRGYYTASEQNELNMLINQKNEHIAKALKHLYSAGEDAYGMCKFLNDMYWRQLIKQLNLMGWRVM